MSSKVTKTIVIFACIILCALVAFIGFLNGFDYVKAQDHRLTTLQERFEDKGTSPITEYTPGAVEVAIPRAATSDDIANILKNKKLIESTFSFKMLSKFNGFDGRYQAGTHYLTPEMSYDEIMYLLTHTPEAIVITIPEGYTYKQLQQRLIDSGLNIDIEYMDELVKRPNMFIDYSFVQDIEVHEQRTWLLQGYLWPDTYRFDPSMDEMDILRMFLNNTQQKLTTGNYAEKAAEMGLTMDQVITLASIVQTEGHTAEMYKIGRVFLNRLNSDIGLESCATINYLRLENNEEPVFWVQQSDLDRFQYNPYNTYAYDGLPPGPINNPGLAAIEGVLWPASERTWPGAFEYLYFCADGKGNNVFAKTYEEQLENIEFYRARSEED
ncbi:MAG: endolytic transglycosylase MltG [Clostridiaceae bacterium]|jgi:UPF0755 protein|nr:endolytic transglycosylase MltG [Bacillota bacterium]NLN51604.1 endolytic transglycosylase MltG [Clostridiaceae bacterium]